MKPVQVLPKVRVDGVDVREPLRLSSLRVSQCLDAPAQCELTWSVAMVASRCLEQPGLAPGRPLRVYIDNQAAPVFTGEITAVEHVHEPSGGLALRARAYDALVRLQRRQTLRTHVEVTTVELARALTVETGLRVSAEASGPVWPRIVPRFAHDLALLREYTARSGLHFVVEDDLLRLFAGRDERVQPLRLMLGEELFEARVECNAVRPIDEVKVLGWDPHTGEPRQGSINDAGALPGAAYGDRAAQRTLLGLPLESDLEAEALATAELAHSRAAGAVLWGVAEGDVALRPGQWVQVRGVATTLEGPYLLTLVTHTVDAENGYVCELSTRPESPGRAPSVPSVVLGEVCDIDDPEGRDRVQVNLDSYGDAVSTWMMVMQLGAGAGKGLVALPEVGDQVVVALPDGDPSRGIVLGGVYRLDGPPRDPKAVRKRAAHRPYTFTTRGGQRIRLNDADGSIRMEIAEGSFLALSREGVVLHAAGELVLEAQGERLILRADTIDLERG
ncbi:phage baseplate assembly protein V [Nitrococcus mobilis]|uniref:Gp5/Type VI secretion system Vgr protein OB-fold domain-containing protein n=1 Tax=Nitrococcus mobilis Nb-231 TaxID=314278 RepID=A4BRD9_9GAMM|nr:phage baseplate assembly protein V [Nitrococcus mobilis]EAR21761.1 hypothetical protein NB231_03490 [Nitrococcus mobilis Nb-231]